MFYEGKILYAQQEERFLFYEYKKIGKPRKICLDLDADAFLRLFK